MSLDHKLRLLERQAAMVAYGARQGRVGASDGENRLATGLTAMAKFVDVRAALRGVL